MMKNLKHIILFFTLIFSVAFSSKIAVATKVKGQVEIMAVGKKDDMSNIFYHSTVIDCIWYVLLMI